MALSAFWHGTAPVQHDTAIEACPAGWLWGAALPDNLRHAAAFVDTDVRKGVAESAPLDNLYDRLVASSRLLSDWISETQVTKVQVCDASPLWCERPVQNRLIKVGDASMSIDPLAAQGVQVALGSARGSLGGNEEWHGFEAGQVALRGVGGFGLRDDAVHHVDHALLGEVVAEFLPSLVILAAHLVDDLLRCLVDCERSFSCSRVADVLDTTYQ